MEDIPEKKKRGRKKEPNLRELSEDEKDKIFKKNKEILESVARRYANIFPDLTIEDLIQTGTFGLFRAAETFDPEKGSSFSTYAYSKIRGTITRTLTDQGRLIRLPANVVEDLTQCYEASNMLFHKLGKNPSIEEISIEAGVPVHRVQRVKRFIRELKISSLEGSIEGKEEETGKLVEFIADEKSESPIDSASKKLLLIKLREFFKKNLSPRNEKIINLKFDLEDGMCHTDKEIGKKVGLTTARVGQILNIIFRQTKRHFNLSEDEL